MLNKYHMHCINVKLRNSTEILNYASNYKNILPHFSTPNFNHPFTHTPSTWKKNRTSLLTYGTNTFMDCTSFRCFRFFFCHLQVIHLKCGICQAIQFKLKSTKFWYVCFLSFKLIYILCVVNFLSFYLHFFINAVCSSFSYIALFFLFFYLLCLCFGAFYLFEQFLVSIWKTEMRKFISSRRLRKRNICWWHLFNCVNFVLYRQRHTVISFSIQL